MNAPKNSVFIFFTVVFGIVLFSQLLFAQRSLVIVEKKEDLRHGSGKIGDYVALVIGINNYKDPNIPALKTAVNDASEMAKILSEKYGFKVDLLIDEKATRAEIMRKLREVAVSAKEGDSILIYYAGHGEIDRELNDGWWVPYGAKGGDPVTYIENTSVQKVIKATKARHVLLISDSCYSGTLFGESRALPPHIDDRYYFNLYNEKSRWGITSGNKTPVSDSGSGGHSIFAYQFLKQLKKNEKPYIAAQEIFTTVAPIITNNSEQQPLCRPMQNTGDQGGQFVFVSKLDKAVLTGDEVKTTTDAMSGAHVDDEIARARKQLEEQRKKLEMSKLELERKKLDDEKSKLADEMNKAEIERLNREIEKQKAQVAFEERKHKLEAEKERLQTQLAMVGPPLDQSAVIEGKWKRDSGNRLYQIYKDQSEKNQYIGKCLQSESDSQWINMKQLKFRYDSGNRFVGTSLWKSDSVFKEGSLEIQVIDDNNIRYITKSPFNDAETLTEIWTRVR